jgi:hypothetical protein
LSDKEYEKLILNLRNTETQDFKIALKTLFTPYQINIIYRKINKQVLSKTDREVYCRIIKKKLYACANEQLFQLTHYILY